MNFSCITFTLAVEIYIKMEINLRIRTHTITAVVCLQILISFLIVSSSRLNVALLHHKAIESIIQFISNFSFWSIIIFAGAITLLALFISEVSDYLGGGALNNFFTGKYHHPREEERIFDTSLVNEIRSELKNNDKTIGKRKFKFDNDT